MKVLLVGQGESGKNDVLSMKEYFIKNGYSEEEIDVFLDKDPSSEKIFKSNYFYYSGKGVKKQNEQKETEHP